MALPQQKEPFDHDPQNQPRREFERRQDERVRRSRLGGRQGSAFWIWIVLFIAAIIWFCGWGWGGYGGWWWGRSNSAVTGPASTGAGSSNGAKPPQKRNSPY